MSNRYDPFLTSLTQRILYLAVLTIALIVAGFVYLENRELHKLLKPTFWVKAQVIVFQFLAIIMGNYLLAGKEKNWTDPLTELCIVLAAGCACVAFVGPYLFTVQTGVIPGVWWNPLSSDQPIMECNLRLRHGGIALCVILATISVGRVVKHTQSRIRSLPSITDKSKHFTDILTKSDRLIVNNDPQLFSDN